MQLFYDEELTKPVTSKGVDLDIVWFMNKKAKTKTVWLFNETKAALRDIKVAGLDASVNVECPDTLGSMEKAPIRFTWKPQKLKDLGLDVTFKVVATEVYTG